MSEKNEQDLRETIGFIEAKMNELHRESQTMKRHLSIFKMVMFCLGAVIAIGFWKLNFLLPTHLFGSTSLLGVDFGAVARSAGSIVFVLSSIPLAIHFGKPGKGIVLSISIMVGIIGSGLFNSAWTSSVSIFLAVAAILAVLVIYFLKRQERTSE